MVPGSAPRTGTGNRVSDLGAITLAMGKTYKGRTADGEEWVIRLVKDHDEWKVMVFLGSSFWHYPEFNLHMAELRAGRIMGLRKWRPLNQD